jgi:DNA-binding LytR/AlgR family response regulator
MSNIKILIAEDEAPQRLGLQRLITELVPEAQQVAACEDGLSALEALQQNTVDIAFLDIRMPGLSGLEIAKLAPTSVQIIFTTAYDEYAIKAFDAGAVDYLLKPIKRERLQQAIDRAIARRIENATSNFSYLLETLEKKLVAQPSKSIKWITASIGDTVKMFAIDEVIFFQAKDKYIRVVTQTDEAIIRTPLKELLYQLDPEIFWQVHRSVVVRVASIDRISKDELGHFSLQLKQHPETLPISSAFQSRFKGM